MIAVVGRAGDASAEALVASWRAHGAALLSPRDLSHSGWRHRPDAPLAGEAVVSGRVVAVRDIRAVVTTLEAVTVADLPHIVQADQAYVASEMRAFLLAWLSALPGRVLNPPTPWSLAGCGWPQERWRLAAASLGIPTGADVGGPEVIKVGDHVLHAPSARIARWVRLLAHAAAAWALVVRFSDGPRPRLLAVGTVPDFRRPGVADAALEALP